MWTRRLPTDVYFLPHMGHTRLGIQATPCCPCPPPPPAHKQGTCVRWVEVGSGSNAVCQVATVPRCTRITATVHGYSSGTLGSLWQLYKLRPINTGACGARTCLDMLHMSGVTCLHV